MAGRITSNSWGWVYRGMFEYSGLWVHGPSSFNKRNGNSSWHCPRMRAC